MDGLTKHGIGKAQFRISTIQYIHETANEVIGALIYRPSFRENKPKTLVFGHRKRAFWACFRKNWVYKFSHGRAYFVAFLYRNKEPFPK
jgi:hypothetical protein